MQQKPLISYVVTTYNIEEFVEESVKCAFEQTYSPLEIVLSDDCSSDHTYEIMEKMVQNYRGPHKIVLNRNQCNLGIAKHMNKAYLELANGKIIVAAHGDDLSMPERTEKSYEYLVSHPEVTALSFSMEAFDETGHVLENHSARVNEIHEYNFIGGGNIPAPSRCFYKKVMEVFGPLNDDCPTEDELISFRSLLLGKNVFLPECMVKYRKHKGSCSNPENFFKFPLEKILEQQDCDMKKAVQMQLIDNQMRIQKYKELEKGMEIRKRYRKYFASRKIKDLMRLVFFDKVSIPMKMHYLKEHGEYLLGNE